MARKPPKPRPARTPDLKTLVPEASDLVIEPQETIALSVNGQEYPLVHIGLPELTQFLQWVKKRLPDPLESIADHMAKFSPEIQQIMIKDALARFYKPVTMGSPEYMESFLTDDGLKQIVWYSVQKAGHDLTREQTDQAVEAIQEQGMKEVGLLFATVAPSVKVAF